MAISYRGGKRIGGISSGSSSVKRSPVVPSSKTVKQIRAHTNPEVKKGSPFWEAGFSENFTPIPGKEAETGKVTSDDYVKEHVSAFGTAQPQSLEDGLSNVYGGSHTVIKDEETGAIVVMDSGKDHATLIEPPGGLSDAERKGVIGLVDQAGDVPNIGEVLTDTQTPKGDFLSGESFFGGDSYTQSYTEGDLSTSTEGGSTGKISKGMLLVMGAVLVGLYVLFGRGGK